MLKISDLVLPDGWRLAPEPDTRPGYLGETRDMRRGDGIEDMEKTQNLKFIGS